MMITTIHGYMDDSELEHRTGRDDHEDHFVEWSEYWLGEEMVHRSVHVTFTEGLLINSAIGEF